MGKRNIANTMSYEQLQESLSCCAHISGRQCTTCPHRIFGWACKANLAADALVYIIRLEAECKALRRELKEVQSNNKTEKKGRACYCSSEVPETDCEGCNFVLTCTNCYEPSEVKA